ncbi:hypothetical protein AXF42_Ash018589 [Apostasia shenzhenica]|uniref:Myb/SANT-like domain-containing protein n=1 Tax=Apostasia shenzhenica TaxID=1088818 RepID=A0A2I0APZ9_9ASPA|nr:hypothetical protein AXF42_Ash018589 [Apostasia shenzhenica]
MNEIFHKVYDSKKLKEQWRKYKQRWRLFHEVLQFSGFGWRSDVCRIETSPEVWAIFLEVSVF